jgi:hypothetical protein
VMPGWRIAPLQTGFSTKGFIHTTTHTQPHPPNTARVWPYLRGVAVFQWHIWEAGVRMGLPEKRRAVKLQEV